MNSARASTSRPRKPPRPPAPDGVILAENLARLGYAEVVVRMTEVARLVTENSGRTMSRQRVSQLLNAVRIQPGTIEVIARGLGVEPAELTRSRE